MDFLNDADDTATLWRYMDLSKFLDLILHKKLVFPRYDKFEDPFEGYASNFMELVRKELQNNGFEDGGLNFGGSCFSDFVDISNHYAYVSCWHHNDHESAGMWKLYCSTPESLAIKTSVEALKKSLSKNKEYNLIFSKVTYDSKLEGYAIKDLSNVNVFNALLMKRESFDHEKEYRILLIDNADRVKVLESHHQKCEDEMNAWFDEREIQIQELKKTGHSLSKAELTSKVSELIMEKYIPTGTNLNIIISELKKNRPIIKTVDLDLNTLIEEIVIAPYAPSWFVRTIEKLISDLGYNFKVSQSKLYELS